MKYVFIISSLIIPLLLYSQGNETTFPKINKNDSITLSKTFKVFIKALEDNDKSKIRELSLTEIECITCIESPEYNEEGYFTSIDNFLQNIQNFNESQIDKAYHTRGFRLMCMNLENFTPRTVPKNNDNNLILYHVWINTYLQDEWAKGHEGVSHAFQFVKIKGEFKFYGLTSIP